MRLLRRTAVTSLVAFALAACGGSTSLLTEPVEGDGGASTTPTNGTTTLGGTAGEAFTPAASFAVSIADPANTPGINETTTDLTVTALAISQGDIACADLLANDLPASAKILSIDVVSTSTVPPPGTYTLSVNVVGGTFSATAQTLNDACLSTRGSQAVGGTVVVATSTASGITGTFDIGFPDGDLTGTFDMPICATIDASHLNESRGTCLH